MFAAQFSWPVTCCVSNDESVHLYDTLLIRSPDEMSLCGSLLFGTIISCKGLMIEAKKGVCGTYPQQPKKRS